MEESLQSRWCQNEYRALSVRYPVLQNHLRRVIRVASGRNEALPKAHEIRANEPAIRYVEFTSIERYNSRIKFACKQLGRGNHNRHDHGGFASMGNLLIC